MNRDKIVFFVLVVVCSSFSLAQKSKNNYSDLLSVIFDEHDGAISFIKNKCKIPKDEKVYFLENEYLKQSDQFSDRIAIKDEAYFIENLNRNVFYVKEIIKDTKLAVVLITYISHHGISLYLHKSKEGKWYISEYAHRRPIQLKDTPAVLLKGKVDYLLKKKVNARIKEIKVGMTYDEVRKTMDVGRGIVFENYYTTPTKRDTLLVLEYRNTGYMDEHKIYLDKHKKVSVVQHAQKKLDQKNE